MSHPTGEELLRLLAGELDEEREKEVRQALAADPELEAELRGLTQTWQELDAPQADPAPTHFRVQVMERVRLAATRDRGLPWAGAPTWARGAAAAALMVGAITGALVTQAALAEAESEDEAWALDLVTLAESYTQGMELDLEGDNDEENLP